MNLRPNAGAWKGHWWDYIYICCIWPLLLFGVKELGQGYNCSKSGSVGWGFLKEKLTLVYLLHYYLSRIIQWIGLLCHMHGVAALIAKYQFKRTVFAHCDHSSSLYWPLKKPFKGSYIVSEGGQNPQSVFNIFSEADVRIQATKLVNSSA